MMRRAVVFATVCIAAGVCACGAQEVSRWRYAKDTEAGSSYTLFYGDAPLPHNVSRPGARITTDFGTYAFGVNKAGKVTGGWNPVSEKNTNDVLTTDEPIAVYEAMLGFYRAGFEEERRDTPRSWVFVEFSGIGYWVDPEKIDRLSAGQLGTYNRLK